ncbi:MAG: TcfC E-set like domain-containing protein [Alphaproteobacteria bacterium]
MPSPAFARLSVSRSIPEGFELLQAPRQTSITLYYGGSILGNFAAEFTPTHIGFSDPVAITKLIPDIKDEAAILQVLANPLPSNAGLVCGRREHAGCGTLNPSVAGVIFNEHILKAELFIHPDYLVVQGISQRYLPLPVDDFSSVYRFDGAVSGNEGQTTNYTLSSASIYALGEAALATQTTWTNEGVRFDTANLGIERNGWRASAGLMRSQAMRLASDRDIAGVFFGSSMRTRLDSHKVMGNDILVYLPRRSFVSIYREGRLYASQSYEAGNQSIDTSTLPDGAYNITLRIQESDGTTREETRFFAKSEQIPPPDMPSYYVQAGVTRKELAEDSTVPQFTGKPLLRVGSIWRVADNTGMELSLLGISDRAATEAGLFWLGEHTQARISALGSSAADSGIQGNVLYIYQDWSATLDARQQWAGDDPPSAYDGLFADMTQATASINYSATEDITVSTRGSYVKNSGLPAITSFGPSITWRLWQQGESTLFASADIARVENETEGAVLLRFSYRFGEYGATGQAGARMGGSAPGSFGAVRLWGDKTSADASLLYGVGISGDRNTRSANADADWKNRYGRIQGGVQKSFGDDSATAYGGTFSLSAAQQQDSLHIGGFDSNSSAVAVEVEGAGDTEFLIYINSSERGTLRAGGRQVIYLPPYNSYRMRVVPIGGDMVSVTGGEKKVVLYPGNVVPVRWQASQFTVVAGQVLQPDGAPLAHARIKDSSPAIITDAAGRFQAELTQLAALTFEMIEGGYCMAALPGGIRPQNGVLLLHEALVCK